MDILIERTVLDLDGRHRDINTMTSAEWKEVARLEDNATVAYQEGDLQSFKRAVGLWRSLFEKGCAEGAIFGTIIKEEYEV